MKKINRALEGVSPIIATILIIAITVILTVSLFESVQRIAADEPSSPLFGRFNTHDDRTLTLSLSMPTKANLVDVTVSVFGDYEDGDSIALTFNDWDEDNNAAHGDHQAKWSLMHSEGRIGCGSRLRFYADGDEFTFHRFEQLEVVLRIKGHTGGIHEEF